MIIAPHESPQSAECVHIFRSDFPYHAVSQVESEHTTFKCGLSCQLHVEYILFATTPKDAIKQPKVCQYCKACYEQLPHPNLLDLGSLNVKAPSGFTYWYKYPDMTGYRVMVIQV